jgi:hypothetical protein
MSTQIQITPKTGITIGTTPITNGTDTRILYQVGGKVAQNAMLTLNDTGVENSTTANFANTFKRTGNSFSIFNASTYEAITGNGAGLYLKSSYETVSTAGNNHNFLIGTGAPVSAMYINSSLNIGIGTTSPQSRLDVKSQGALSTDLPFRVRNSADTQNSFQIDGLGQGKIKSTSYIPKFSISYDWAGGERNAFVFTQSVQNFRGQAWTFDAGYNGNAEGLVISNDLTGNDQGYFSIRQNNFNFGGVFHPAEFSSERKVLRIYNGVAPSARAVSEVDFFKMFSKDIVAGNAAPHFETENGDIIKLYKQSSAGILTVPQLVTVLQNLGLLS